MAVSQGPGPGENRLGLQRRSGRPCADFMGHHTLQISLQRHLLQQGPAAVGIGLQPEGSTHHTAFPTQSIRGLHLQRSLKRAATLRPLQHRSNHGRNRGCEITQGHTGQIRRIERCPHLPLIGVGDLGLHTLIPPTIRKPLG